LRSPLWFANLFLFKDGQVAATKVGALSKTQLVEFINENI
jgi:thioredoxin 1